ncbi:MAG: glycosyltransferase family 2 protein [Bacteroidota bacterium]
MNFYIVIPAHNEETFLAKTLESLVTQSLLPKQVVVVNDNSTDGTQQIIDSFAHQYPFVSGITITSEGIHAPGSKVINAFYKGFDGLDGRFDVICKFDADLIFPKNYLKTLAEIFRENEKVGMVGGFCYIQKNGQWELENLTNKDHIRGALKAYRKECFHQIEGLKKAMGWDTVDELLAQFHGWRIYTDTSLKVKHLKATGATYTQGSGQKQGQAFKKMRYGFWLTLIASIKLAVKKGSFGYFWNCLKGYFGKIDDYLVTEEEGKFIRKLRWRKIRNKLFRQS